MSDIHATAVPAVEPTEPVVASAVPVVSEPVVAAEPVTDASKPAVEESSTDVPAAVAPAEEEKKTDATVEKVIEPVSEGQLAYKGPGLVKSLIPSKKEFWLSDAAVSPQHMDLYLRGEKPEISYPVVAWASHTGQGLLFFNKKGDTDRTHPSSVLALYDATDLKKSSPHEILFRLNGHQHTLKAANDAERDGWFVSLEKAIELGKAQKETVRDSEGYKAEIEKLNKPNLLAAGAGAGVGGVAGAVAQSKAKKSTELDQAEGVTRAASDVEEETKKTQKSRSTSRGILNRLRNNKEESEVKKEEKEEKKVDESVVEEAAPVIPGGSVLDAQTTADRVADAPVEETATTEVPAVDGAAKTEEKPKINKRNSIFGKMQGWGSMKSPVKEKDIKDAELKSEAPIKDGAEVTPEIATEAPLAPVVDTTAETTVKPAEAVKEQTGAVSPSQKSGFLSGLPFLNKRNRSVSPSAVKKEEPVKSEEAAVPASEDVTEAVTAPATSEVDKPFVDAPITQAPVTDAVAAEKPVEKTEEATKAEKRQSVLGSLGRRASKALNRMQAPKKEAPAVPAAADVAKEESVVADATPAADKTVANDEHAVEAKTEQVPAIGDVVPEAVTATTSTPVVTASA
ncbi:Hypothetical protein R9X50_00244900 [Acrodontium crateriforme]|uniref:Meiotic expression up-regulated protein 6 PH domain-containing protein n=1 Tax=Acrodontium crateriforme TaxID=150365 RepID=A0AAQ3M268_9PEZI|nr:Hypothetical protein R9X50_00244900 [Acrodontium crateriforme]